MEMEGAVGIFARGERGIIAGFRCDAVFAVDVVRIIVHEGKAQSEADPDGLRMGFVGRKMDHGKRHQSQYEPTKIEHGDLRSKGRTCLHGKHRERCTQGHTTTARSEKGKKKATEKRSPLNSNEWTRTTDLTGMSRLL